MEDVGNIVDELFHCEKFNWEKCFKYRFEILCLNSQA